MNKALEALEDLVYMTLNTISELECYDKDYDTGDEDREYAEELAAVIRKKLEEK